MRLEARQPKRLVMGFSIVSEGRVLGITTFPGLEGPLALWARTGQPRGTRAILFPSDPCERLPEPVPTAELCPEALAAAERVARAAPTPYPLATDLSSSSPLQGPTERPR